VIGLSAPVSSVALVGAHCDDIAIGAGGTIAALCAARPGLTVRALVCSGGGTARETEERAALAACCAGAALTVTVLDLPDGRLPEHRPAVKSALRALAAEPTDLVFAPQPGDAHQDHRLLAEIVPTEFRDQLTLGYEILKWEGDLPAVTVYQALTAEQLDHKIELLHRHYPSQQHRDWFDREAFAGLARLRGVQNHTRYAEAFVVGKARIDLLGEQDTATRSS
jgi:LmbE family N-acetylglucosaminyl deacetylase